MILPFLKNRIGGANIDLSPDAFSFPTVTGAGKGVYNGSAIRQITGITVPVPVTTVGGQVRVLDTNGSTDLTGWVNSATVKNGQYIQLAQYASATSGATLSMNVQVGPFNAIWYIVTQPVVAGSASWGAGNYSFTIPDFNTFNVDVYAAGGGGGGMQIVDYSNETFTDGSDGAAGGGSSFNGWVTAGGGAGGGRGQYVNYLEANYYAGGAGGHGNGSGGNPVYAGGAGGGAGAIGYGGAGGNGGRAYYTWVPGQGVNPGAVISVSVGYGGGGGDANPYWGVAGAGGNGAIYVSWS